MDLEDELRHVLQDPTRGPSPDFGDRVLPALPARQRPLLWPLRDLAAPLGAAAMVVAVMLAVGVIGPATGPNRSAAPLTASPDSTATSAAPSGTYPDGIPRQIDGQPVLRGEAILSHVAQSQDATPFLVGGYVYTFYADCYVEPGAPGSPLLAACDDGFHLGDAPPGTGGGFGSRLVIDAALQDLPGGAPGVLQDHVHDRRAADCASAIRQRCEQAIVVEAVVWAGTATLPVDGDGIPRERSTTRRSSEAPTLRSKLRQLTTRDDSSSVAGRRVRCCGAALRRRPAAPPMPCCPVVRGRASMLDGVVWTQPSAPATPLP
jgi:hypothetical protein